MQGMGSLGLWGLSREYPEGHGWFGQVRVKEGLVSQYESRPINVSAQYIICVQ